MDQLLVNLCALAPWWQKEKFMLRLIILQQSTTKLNNPNYQIVIFNYLASCPLLVTKINFMKTPSAMKDRMLEIARQDGYIDSIFNYCDRWCEKCAFTLKCRNYAFSEDAPDNDGPELFEYLGNVFKATMLMLEEMMVKMDLDPEEIKNMEFPEKPDPKDHPLYKKVYALSFKMHDWLKENKPGELPSELEITPQEKCNTRFHESIEVIYWYNFFISAKIFRALGGMNLSSFEDKIQNDSNGSAKIALVALDRLIGAWSVVMGNMKDHEDEILKFLISLSEVRKLIEKTFPNTKIFVRPGFDQQRNH